MFVVVVLAAGAVQLQVVACSGYSAPTKGAITICGTETIIPSIILSIKGVTPTKLPQRLTMTAPPDIFCLQDTKDISPPSGKLENINQRDISDLVWAKNLLVFSSTPS